MNSTMNRLRSALTPALFSLAVVVLPLVAYAIPQIKQCSFGRNLHVGVSDPAVRCLQRFLNGSGFPLASSGAGSPGNETEYFGPRTQRAVVAWQRAMGVAPSFGFFGPVSRMAYRALVGPTPEAMQAAVSSVSPSVVALSSPPAIRAIAPDHPTDGDEIMVTGAGFSPSENFVRFSIDPPGFAGRRVAAHKEGTALLLLVRTGMRDKIASQFSGFSADVRDALKKEYARQINTQYPLAPAGSAAAYLPVLVTVRNERGTSLPFTLYVNVIP